MLLSPAPQERKLLGGKGVVCVLWANCSPWGLDFAPGTSLPPQIPAPPHTRPRHLTLMAGGQPGSSTTALLASPPCPMGCKPGSSPGSLHFYYAQQDPLSLDVFCSAFLIFREWTCFCLLLWVIGAKYDSPEQISVAKELAVLTELELLPKVVNTETAKPPYFILFRVRDLGVKQRGSERQPWSLKSRMIMRSASQALFQSFITG